MDPGIHLVLTSHDLITITELVGILSGTLLTYIGYWQDRATSAKTKEIHYLMIENQQDPDAIKRILQDPDTVDRILSDGGPSTET